MDFAFTLSTATMPFKRHANCKSHSKTVTVEIHATLTLTVNK